MEIDFNRIMELESENMILKSEMLKKLTYWNISYSNKWHIYLKENKGYVRVGTRFTSK